MARIGPEHCLDQRRRMWVWVAAVGAALLLLTFVAPLRAATGGFVQHTVQGRINWLTGEVRAIGQGKAVELLQDEQTRQQVMRRQALINGRRHLYNALQAVRINSSLTVGDLVAEDAAMREKLKGRVNNSVVLDRIVVPGERVRLKVGIKLWGKLSEMLIPASVWYKQPSRPSQQDLDRSQGRNGRAMEYTGLIVDARGLDVSPSLICRLYGPEERLLYGPGVVRPSIAIGRGMAGYMEHRGKAVRATRSGGNPLILRAEDRASSYGCELTLSAAASERLLPRPGNLGFLRRGKVIILVGSAEGQQPTEYQLEE
ncbi:MAG: hypothetical protein K9K39_02685 [Desulfohalobiaceae bacterium]|nr:hypothetical protein [Desulfohalobiaceae bacterium]